MSYNYNQGNQRNFSEGSEEGDDSIPDYYYGSRTQNVVNNRGPPVPPQINIHGPQVTGVQDRSTGANAGVNSGANRFQSIQPLPQSYRPIPLSNLGTRNNHSTSDHDLHQRARQLDQFDQQQQQQQQQQQASGVYISSQNSPSRQSAYSVSPNRNNHYGDVADTSYYNNTDYRTNDNYYSALPPTRSSSIVNRNYNNGARSPRLGGFPVSQNYAPSLNENDDDDLELDNPYRNSYVMDTNPLQQNGSSTNVPFIRNNNDFFTNGNNNNINNNNNNINKARPNNYFDAFEPYQYDEQDQFENDFAPFPISGDSYQLNTFIEDAPTTVVDSQEDDDNQSYIAGSDDPFNLKETSVVNDYGDGSESPIVTMGNFGDEQDIIMPPAEGQQPRRGKTMIKKVQMINGNLVLDCPVSQKLLAKYPEPLTEHDREFLFMRYQAATCDPSEFVYSNFTLRQKCYKEPRVTEIMIVITMYNESDVLLARTLKGVLKNIKYLMSKKRSSTWGPDAWKKIVVCIVSDGRTIINPRARALLAALGVYQEGFAKNMVNDKAVVSHIYEYTSMVGISSIKDDMVKLTTEKTTPVQLLFCLKEKNQKKINSHRWCFQAFGPILDPNIVVLLDAGTQPSSDSIYHLWKSFDRNPSVAGSCGEIKASLGKGGALLINPLVAAQNFEYKTSNILDKPMESVFGFVTVLPGAFSAYRYVALQNDVTGEGPLSSYFKGESLHDSSSGIFTANMYLAEDRILCFELVAKRDCRWVLKYVKAASATTDVPERLPEFILQRRRWLNGSFFAAIYSVSHFYKIYGSAHSIIRKFFLHVQLVYQILSLLVSWFSLGSYFLVFRILTVDLSETDLDFAPGNILSVILLWLYLASLVTTFILSFGNRPKGTEMFYIVISIFFAILMAYMIFAAIYMSVYAIKDIISETSEFTVSMIFTSTKFRDLIVATCSTYLLYFLGAFLFLDPWHMFTSFVQYLLLSPSYVNVLNIYAFCNIHDISWGTKGDNSIKLDLGVAKTSSSGKLEVDIPTFAEDIDNSYTEQINVLLKNPNDEEKIKKIDPEEKKKDYYAFIRSMTVLFWMFSNFVIIAIVLETGGIDQLGWNDSTDDSGYLSTNTSVFLTVILWLVAFMALFRFVGCVSYLFLRIIGK
ncbi:hypothetical protein PACTADRAFT_47944 [Pachysolen tannophilus NRRL Y-2460]|uniref:chitin synthase n=1 Tax=Pachysolen tannophilus NRRL Y-2460 TaxID=669874 RepID=A0A1E4U296_PACTA|nr:hypothetical protein PACTADRAFT_47944 [Pachysolen tannophilus NRRL Y-2460]